MALVLANPDGSSNARPGDVVVTGGGLFRKNADGSSTYAGRLPTSTGTTRDYGVVVNTFREMSNLPAGWSGPVGNPSVQSSGTPQPKATIESVDPNGIASVIVEGYDPADYGYYVVGSAGSSSGSPGGSVVAGYLVLGLLGLVLLERFAKGGKRK